MPSKVAISTVTKGSLQAFVAAWRERALLQMHPNVELQWEVSSKPLQTARCAQVDTFMASTCTHLFLLDSDVLPPERTVQKLLAYNLPMIAAPHSARKGDEIGVMVLDRDGNGAYKQHHPWRPGSGLQGPNVVVGCAGMLIRRDVFEKVGKPWFQCTHDKVDGHLIRSEDFEFCDRVHAAGIPIWALCDLVVQHKISWVM